MSKKNDKKTKKSPVVMEDGEKIKYDIVSLIQTERYDTKPNMGKFLKTYVSSIRNCISDAKVQVYPTVEYKISKTIIRFNDESTLIRDDSKETIEYYIYCGVDEIQIKEKEQEIIS